MIRNTVKPLVGRYTRITFDTWGNPIFGDTPTKLEDYGITNAVKNEKDTPGILADTFSNIPDPTEHGRLFLSTDTGEIYRDDGNGNWVQFYYILNGGAF